MNKFLCLWGASLSLCLPLSGAPVLDTVSHSGTIPISFTAPTPPSGTGLNVSSASEDYSDSVNHTHSAGGGNDTFTGAYNVDTTVTSLGEIWTLDAELGLTTQVNVVTGVGVPVSFSSSATVSTTYTFTLEQSYSYVLTGEIIASVARPASSFTGTTSAFAGISLDRVGGPLDIEDFSDSQSTTELEATPVSFNESGLLGPGTYTLTLSSTAVLSGTGTTPAMIATSAPSGNFSLELTAVPEPGAAGLVLLSGVVLLIRRRRTN